MSLTEKEKRYANARNRQLREAGLCSQCKRKSLTYYCAECRRPKYEARKRVLAERKRLGLCVYCSAPVLEGHTFCAEHLQKVNTWTNKREKGLMRVGLCRRCRSPREDSPSRSYCMECLHRVREGNKKAQAKRRETLLNQNRCIHCRGEKDREGRYCVRCLRLCKDRKQARRGEK